MTVARVTLLPHGQVMLPPEVRAALKVQDGDQLEFEVSEDDVRVRGVRLVLTDQAWFWTKEWQQGEASASADIAAGRTTRYEDGDAFLRALGELGPARDAADGTDVRDGRDLRTGSPVPER